MQTRGKATRIHLLNFSTPQMRAFHMSWMAFFLCFFAWFGIAPLMTVVREEMALTKTQVGWCVIGSVAITVLARLFVGWLCDKIGPRRAYAGLLIAGSLPVMGIALADDFQTFLLFRVLIGAIGASFVITQYHTSLMFAGNCVGTANATTAGWGNLGGGVTQFVMPLVFTFFVGAVGFSSAQGWRLSMVVAGVACAVTGVAYFLLTQDTPEGDLKQLRAQGKLPAAAEVRGTFGEACRDPRVWALAVMYGACFGIELTVNNVAALYFVDYFAVFREMETIQAARYAGLIAASFGLMNLFARTLGGAFGDKCGSIWGLSGRVKWLFVTLFCEGLLLMVFSQISVLALAIPALVIFSLFVQMSEGATFAIVPFVNRRALGSVSGIVGAGGNAGAVAVGFLFKAQGLSWPTAFLVIGAAVLSISFLSFAVRFSEGAEAEFDRPSEAAPRPSLAYQPALQES
ncbi:MAG: MFS transporter [Planctomycetota bacterium]|nr:MAG: MFS transporter [Planctomycetota bacterium]